MEANEYTKERHHLRPVPPEPTIEQRLAAKERELRSLRYRIIRPLVVRSAAMLRAKRALREVCETSQDGLARPQEVAADIASLAVMWRELHCMMARNATILARVGKWEALAPVEPPPPAA
jgi:hypothetical protein